MTNDYFVDPKDDPFDGFGIDSGTGEIINPDGVSAESRVAGHWQRSSKSNNLLAWTGDEDVPF
jgi:hypothetical protein